MAKRVIFQADLPQILPATDQVEIQVRWEAYADGPNETTGGTETLIVDIAAAATMRTQMMTLLVAAAQARIRTATNNSGLTLAEGDFIEWPPW